jgi:hypothetical protein
MIYMCVWSSWAIPTALSTVLSAGAYVCVCVCVYVCVCVCVCDYKRVLSASGTGAEHKAWIENSERIFIS